MSDQNWYYCEHEVYYEDNCYLCDNRRKQEQQSIDFYVGGRKIKDMKIIEDLAEEHHKKGDLVGETALKEALEQVRKS